MAVTLPGKWELQERGEIRAGYPVRDDSDHDLVTLNQRTAQGMAYNVRSVLAYGGVGSGQWLDDAGSVLFTERYAGSVQTWTDAVRVKLHVYGEYVDAQVVLGGSSISVAAGALGWHATASTLISGFTRDANGFSDLFVKIRQNTTSGNRRHQFVVVEEMPLLVGDLPDSDNADADYQRVDDAAMDPDNPLDGWLLQTLTQNAIEAQRIRTRGCCVMVPQHTDYTPPAVSSAFERADGPYMLEALPWATSGELSIVCEATTQDVEVAAFSDLEDRGTTLARVQTVTAGAGNVTLTLPGLKIQGGQTNRLDVYLRGALGAEIT